MPHLSREPGYDPLTSFEIIAEVGRIHLMLVVRPDLGVNSFEEFIALARRSNGRLTYGTAGAGSMAHLASELFSRDFGFTATHVAFRGLAQSVTEMLAGRIDFALDALLSLNFVKEGRIRGLGVTGSRRWPDEPRVPTFAELGRPDVDRYISPIVLLAPARTPEPQLRDLRAWTRDLMATPDMQRKVWGINFEPVFHDAADVRSRLAQDYRTFGGVIRDLGIEGGG